MGRQGGAIRGDMDMDMGGTGRARTCMRLSTKRTCMIPVKKKLCSNPMGSQYLEVTAPKVRGGERR